MKIVLAFDSFKGSLSAKTACRVVANSLHALRPAWHVECVPLADGGEGTAAALVENRRGQWRVVQGVTGPLPDIKVEAAYGWLPGDVAVVEMASVSGLTLLEKPQLNPLLTTSYGTGQLIAAAAEAGAKRIILTLGGSATVDGGTGAARALGWRFLDADGCEVPLGGGGLGQIAQLQRPQLNLPPVEAWCDVRNPLWGREGAACVYGPQKGADEAMVAELDGGLQHLAELVQHQLGLQALDVPGDGAAGGLGFGARAFLGAELIPGAQGVLEVVGLEKALSNADWVITGEGCLDDQSLQGKVVGEVARLARSRSVKVAVLAGQLLLEPARCREVGLAMCEQTMTRGMSAEEAMGQAEALLAVAAQRLVKSLAE
ncbi:MAG: glycerate kinase [Desulfuromonadaceae bacterium]|nr:glycerate kinase [Desulfuromonadaceae bacterium]